MGLRFQFQYHRRQSYGEEYSIFDGSDGLTSNRREGQSYFVTHVDNKKYVSPYLLSENFKAWAIKTLFFRNPRPEFKE